MRSALILLAAAGLGFAAVRLARAPGLHPRSAPVSIPHAPAHLTCVDVNLVPEDDACPDLREDLAACESDLAQATAAHPTTRLPFPDVPEAEQPGPWTDNLTEALQTCGIPGSLEVTDCDEYPCIGAMRLDPAKYDSAAAAWQACPRLKELGLTFGPQTVHCPDGSEEQEYVVWDESAVQSPPPVAAEATPDPTLAAFLLIGRRVESVSQLWECNVRRP